MHPSDPVKTYHPLLFAIQSILESYPGKGVVVGGIAVSLLGEPRLTADVDVLILIQNSDLTRFVETARQVGIIPRVKTRRLLPGSSNFTYDAPTHKYKCDFIMGMLPFEEEVLSRAQHKQIGDLKITLPTVEDLIIMKAVAHRPKDLIDIQGLIRANENLDLKRIEFWIRQFAGSIDQPGLWKTIHTIIEDTTK